MVRKIALLLVLLSLLGCEPTPEIIETPIGIQPFVTSPELEALVITWLTDYYKQAEGRSLYLETLPSDQILDEIESGDLQLGIIGREPPSDWFVTPLLREAIILIVNPDIPIRSLSIAELEMIFSGKVKDWDSFIDEAKPIQLVVPLKGNVFRERFMQVVMDEAAFDPASLLAHSAVALQESVRSLIGGIGFIPASQLEDGMQIVEIEGIAPTETAISSGVYPLWVDIKATSTEEPIGQLRDFLGWLQGSHPTTQ